MDDSVGVQVFESINDLHSIAFDLELMKSLPSLQQFIHTLVMTKLEKNVHIFTVFKKVHKLSNIGVFYTSVNLNFGHQLLFGSASLERSLLDNFGRSYRFVFALDEFIALGEPTFS